MVAVVVVAEKKQEITPPPPTLQTLIQVIFAEVRIRAKVNLEREIMSSILTV